MTFNRNLPQVVFCSLSQSEWALSLLSHWEGLSPSIQSFLPDDVTVLRGLGQKRGSGERKRERDRTQPNLICFFYTCVCLSIREMLTTCHNAFIPIPHHEWLHQPPKYPCNLFTGRPGGVFEGYPYTIYVVFFSEHVSGLLHWDFSGSVSHFCKYPLHGVS